MSAPADATQKVPQFRPAVRDWSWCFSPEQLKDTAARKEAAEATQAQEPTVEINESDRLFRFNGEMVPVSQLRSKMYMDAGSKRSTPIPLLNGGFGFQM